MKIVNNACYNVWQNKYKKIFNLIDEIDIISYVRKKSYKKVMEGKYK